MSREKNGFYDWISRYKEEDTPRGDLARDIIADVDFPRISKNKEQIIEYFEIECDCSFVVINTFKKAWTAFLHSTWEF
jgi:uncharacterized protein YozE (UPF0346 family)